MAEAVNGVPRGSVIGPILIAFYVNGLLDHLSAGSLIYADDFKRIAHVTAMMFSETPFAAHLTHLLPQPSPSAHIDPRKKLTPK